MATPPSTDVAMDVTETTQSHENHADDHVNANGSENDSTAFTEDVPDHGEEEDMEEDVDDDQDEPPRYDNDDQGGGDDDTTYHEYDENGEGYAEPMHDEDEYDPAHPDGISTHADDEYDPANPSEGLDIDRSEHSDPVTTTDADNSTDPVTPSSPTIKREITSDNAPVDPSLTKAATRTAPPPSSTRSPKRQRLDKAPDQRGLKDSAWDRLMDFETTGDFRVAQVSRAAFASIASLPEFAQCAIVARFARTPMKDVRDKNGLIMRLHHEYLGENPHIQSLVPVSSFDRSAVKDAGLFDYGYAPPVPTSGMSMVKIPYRRDKLGVITTPSPWAKALVGSLTRSVPTEAATKPGVDEFGRLIAPKPSTPSGTSAASRPTDPRRTAAPTEETTPVPAPPASSGGTSAPSTPAKPSDPRRRRSDNTATDTNTTRRSIEKSDMYNRLLPSVRARLDTLIHENRLPDAINDNVLSRLNHLPEAAAISAVVKFSEADLRQVGNINGFLVGIINRVQERAPTPTAVPQSHPTPAANPAPRSHQQHPAAHPQTYTAAAPPGAVDHYARYPPQSAPHDSGAAYRDPRLAATAMPHAVGYDRHHTAPPPSSYAAEAPPPWNAAPHGAAPPAHTPARRFSNSHTIDQAIGNLPPSVQNHLLSLVNTHVLPSVDDLSEKCYEVLGQLSEGLANEVLKRFGTANLTTVRNRSGFLIGVVKKCRQEYGFD